MIPVERLTDAQRDTVAEHVKLVYLIVHQLYATRPLPMEFDDAVSVGFLGLMNAALRYDASRGYKFSTYATCCIRNTIFMAMRSLRAQRNNYGIAPLSLDTPLRVEDGEVTLLDILPSTVPAVDEAFCWQVTCEELRGALAALPDREREILTAAVVDMETQESIGNRLEMTQPGVSRAKARALHRLREAMERENYV